MRSYQKQKSLILSFYDNLESANSRNVCDIIAKFTKPDFQWYGVYPFNEQFGAHAVAESF